MAQREVVFPANPDALYEKYRYSAAVRSDNLCSCRVRSAAAPMVRPNPISKLRFAGPSPIWKRRSQREDAH